MNEWVHLDKQETFIILHAISMFSWVGEIHDFKTSTILLNGTIQNHYPFLVEVLFVWMHVLHSRTAPTGPYRSSIFFHLLSSSTTFLLVAFKDILDYGFLYVTLFSVLLWAKNGQHRVWLSICWVGFLCYFYINGSLEFHASGLNWDLAVT